MRNPNRREATLADRFIAQKFTARDTYLARETTDALQRKTRAAHKFIFDADAITHVGRLVRDIPDLLVREIGFARAPFEMTWIEFPHHVLWKNLGNDPSVLVDSEADHTLGYLIDHGTVSTICGGTVAKPHLGPYPSVVQYRLNTEWPTAQQDAFAAIGGVSMKRIDQFIWGSTYNKLDEATMVGLRNRNSIHMMPGILHSHDADRIRRDLDNQFRGGGGELRLVVAMLLALNRPNITRLTSIPPGSGLYRGKNTVYHTHTSVTIDLDPIPGLRAEIASGPGALRRRHEVRGHYCHDANARDYHRIAGCIHEWLPADADWTPLGGAYKADRVNHWLCQTCEGKRWWKTEHTRGDATLGFVSHDDYRVVG